MSMDTDTPARLCVNFVVRQPCAIPYEANIKGLITKIPGFLFMSYRQIVFAGKILVSDIGYKQMLNDVFELDKYWKGEEATMEANFKKLISSYNFTDDIPKEFLFVRLKPGLPKYRREFISNGLRAFLRDDLSFVFDIEDMRATLSSSIALFDLFSLIVGIIALILAFFLLLTSTNANIRDNFWELGVLKAIGLSKS
jgi:ABC-type antimicrobial peptide transport system permease subunit